MEMSTTFFILIIEKSITSPISKLRIFPAMGDAGLCVGGIWSKLADVGKLKCLNPFETIYLGKRTFNQNLNLDGLEREELGKILNLGPVYLSPQISNFGSSVVYSVAYGNGTWVAVGNGGTLRTSTNNGVTWNTQTSNYPSTTIFSVAYANGTWMKSYEGWYDDGDWSIVI